MESAFDGRVFHAKGHEEPAEPAEVKRRQHGAGHGDDRKLRLFDQRAAQGGGEHDEDNDERKRAGRDQTERRELREKRV